MKRLLLLGLSFGIAATSFGQLSYGTKIGQTYYDLHSNSSTGNRLVRNADGSMSATWIEHWDILTADNQPKPNVRGFGYNHFTPGEGWVHGPDGECWEQSYGCASSYVGWPEVINLPSANSNGRQELMFNHTPLKLTTRETVGDGLWSLTSELNIDKGENSEGLTWPRAVSSGNYIHLIGVLPGADQDYVDANGVLIPLRYYRSSDGGATWDIQDGDVFDLVGDIEVAGTVNDTVGILSIDTSSISTVDSSWADTILTGMFTVNSSMFDADFYYLTDSTVNFGIDTANGRDTIVVVSSDTTADGTDTFAIRNYTTYDVTFVYDTNYDIVVKDTVVTEEGLLVDAVGGDAYAIAVNGSTVAVTFGGQGMDVDWVVFISDDNGDTWTRRIAKSNHYLEPEFIINGTDDSYLINMDNFEVAIDDDGKVHVFCGSNVYTTSGDGGYFIGSDLHKEVEAGIMYWNTDMPDKTARVVAFPDFNGDGNPDDYRANTSEYYGFWVQGWPGASIDDNGNIYLLYSAIAENIGADFINPTTGDTLGYMDLYMVYSLDGGDTWCGTDDPIVDNNGLDTEGPINVAEDIFGITGSTPTEDDLFASPLPKVDENGIIHFTWQGDFSRPGLALIDDTHPNDNLNYIMYAGIDVSGLTTGCEIPSTPPTSIAKKINTFNFAIAPNPARDMVTITTDTDMSNIELINMFGQTVKNVRVNSSKMQNVEVNGLAEGVYVVKVTTTQGIATKKLTITK